MLWKTLEAQQRTTAQLNSHGPGRVSNQGHLGERQALYAQANHATQSLKRDLSTWCFLCLGCLILSQTLPSLGVI